MLATSGQNDILRTYFISGRDGVAFNLAYIGTDFVSAPKTGEFDQAFMNSLYEYGYRQIVNGQAWHKMPPALDAETRNPLER